MLDLLAHAEAPRLAPLGTSCPDHFLRTKVRPLLLDLPPSAPLDDRIAPAPGAGTRPTGPSTAPTTSGHADAGVAGRCGAPTPSSCWCPASACSASAPIRQTARIAGEFYVNAINVMRGAEAVSSYAPIPDAEKFRIEYWELEERKLRR